MRLTREGLIAWFNRLHIAFWALFGLTMFLAYINSPLALYAFILFSASFVGLLIHRVIVFVFNHPRKKAIL